jgi:AcrR family transcriptional regulator
MPRPSLTNEKRRELIPVVARAFAELGYRRTTTAELAKRCKVRENILYRLWPDKKAMFIAAIGYVYELAEQTWARLLDGALKGSSAERVLEYESRHLGEFGHSRIIFAGLSETDDPEIRRALSRMYQVALHRGRSETRSDCALAAWALIGLGTVASIGLELHLLGGRERRALMKEMGKLLLDGRAA